LSQQLTIQKEASNSSSVVVDVTTEMDVEPQEQLLLQKNQKTGKVLEIETAHKVVGKLNLSTQESMYNNLYSEIEKAWAHASGNPLPTQTVQTTPVQSTKVPGRNEKCPCGSGKKYKQCHGNKPS